VVEVLLALRLNADNNRRMIFIFVDKVCALGTFTQAFQLA
jgi:hypothetical protein